MPEKPKDLWTDEEFVQAFGRVARYRDGLPYFLGRLQRPGWTGKEPTYLIWCRWCRFTPNGGFTVTHVQGHNRRLPCSYCRTRYDGLMLDRRLLAAFWPHPELKPWFWALLALVAMLVGLAAR